MNFVEQNKDLFAFEKVFDEMKSKVELLFSALAIEMTVFPVHFGFWFKRWSPRLTLFFNSLLALLFFKFLYFVLTLFALKFLVV